MRIRQDIVPIIVASTAALLLASCGPSPLPVDTDVTWEDGREPTGPFEDDPHVKLVREYIIELGAAHNALNYSSQDLADIVTVTQLNHAVPSQVSVEKNRLVLIEGPSSFSVIEVEQVSQSEVKVHVCEKGSLWWTAYAPEYDKDRVSTVKDGDYFRHEHRHYFPATYILNELNGIWRIRTSGISSKECDPGPDVAVGTYTTPPDLNLLTDATPSMVFGPDGEPIG